MPIDTVPTTDPLKLTPAEIAALPANGGPHYNRLVFAKSPYLLQHAANPVDWHPWSDAAFDLARERDCPVLLSIGYSTCHWCHVMAHESFENRDVAELLNRDFVAVKVDREERPDIDATYMTVCQLLTGSGGWPLTLLLTPGREPFFAATYLPPQTRNGQPGLIEVLTKVRQMWADDREQLLLGANRIVTALKRAEAGRPRSRPPDEKLLYRALQHYRDSYDPQHGGFGGAPKFPAPHNLMLLLRLARRFDAADAADMARQTLRAIRAGGIYDQLGFGLHRYAVDRQWLVPHFEKMLYDQALFILAATAARTEENPHFATMALETAAYLRTGLQHPEGGFCAGEDADSDGGEGSFYLWSRDEIEKLLSEEDVELACRFFGIDARGNFEGRTILTNRMEREQLAEDLGETEAALTARIARIRQTLLARRNRRPRPHRDENILTGWNGLAIAALARAGAAFDRPELVAAAEKAADFVLSRLRRDDGRLLRRFFRAEAAIGAFLEDYAGLAFGLAELFLASLEPLRLQQARQLAHQMLELFDDGEGGLSDSGRDAERILVRNRNLQDGAMPSGLSLAIGVLLQLGRLLGDGKLEMAGRNLLERHLAEAERYPRAYSWLLAALDSHLDSEPTLVIAAPDRQQTAIWLETARRLGPPDLLLLPATPELAELDLPLLQQRTPLHDRATAWFCSRRHCHPPVTEMAELERLLATER
ncbi:hypothetical protein EDC39_105136 [Geothermobacter ehrlichii]|uniref:Spermatogenesis-associated protein 20-like TRX domain-containing protein n=1 Tax=Geothermobacter ehrlichii TaxID=213224 RepID=A0A5D3WJM5_9BACT|nr:thioredoxin domain-containing protein [Geothermobacter ehrlichii]TYO98767.1 hypothetical protein EDC39_105136 [Geothermobacter ehrlichii]